MKTLIIYYSETEKTKTVAEALARQLNCYICEIKDLKNRSGYKNRLFSTIDAFRENKTKIYPSSLNLDEFNTIYFGTPTWAGNPTPAINTIIDNCNLKGKDVVLFATMDGNGGESAIEKMEEKVELRGARVIARFTITTKNKSLDELRIKSEAIAESLDLSLF